MEEALELLADVRIVVGVAFVGCCWVAFAEHPTAAGLRQALAETFEL